MGEDNSSLLGAMIITKIQLAAMSRVDLPMEKRSDFYLYVDEFQNFSTESFANILSEARKYRLNLVLAHQYIEQLSEEVRAAVFGNVGTIICFRIGAPDAELLEKEFLPEFQANDLVNLPKYHIYAKLMIDGVASKAFSAETLAPFEVPLESFRDVIIENTRNHFGTAKAIVEKRIADEWRAEAKIIEEKVMRREEKPLGRVLLSQEEKPFFKKEKKEIPSAEPYPQEKKSDVSIEELKKAIEESLKKGEE